MRPPAPEFVVDGQPARLIFDASPFDVLNAPRPLLDAYLAGRLDGFLEGEQVGYARGYTTCDQELARLQRAAAKIVHGMARLPPWAQHVQDVRRRQIEACERINGRLLDGTETAA